MIISTWTILASLVILCCVLLEGFFSGSEIAVISVDKIKLRHFVKLGSKGAQLAQKMLQQPERFLGTTLVGTNLCVVLSSVLLTTILREYPRFQDDPEFYVAVILTPLVLVFGEIVPKSLYQQYADAFVPIIAHPLHIAFRLFYPMVLVVSTATNALFRLLGVSKKERKQTLTRAELKFLIGTDTRNLLADQDRKQMMQRVFDLGDTTVADIMVPLVEVEVLAKGTPIPAAIEKFRACGYSRLPIYEDRVDNLIGVIHAFDLLRATPQDQTIDRFLRKAYYVPNTMRVDDFVQHVQRYHTQIAVVVDEYGGALGIVTLEDSLEEIVGDIDDEFDDDAREKMYERLPDGAFRIHARMEIDEINVIFDFNLPEGTFDTLGGFLLSEFQRIPTVGETCAYEGLQFTIEDANERSILWVHVMPRPISPDEVSAPEM